MRRPWLCLLTLILIAGLAGCRWDFGEEAPRVEPEQATTALIPSPTTEPLATVAAEPTPANVTVTVWGPVELAPGSQVPGGDLLSQQIAAFERSQPGVQVAYEPKPFTGPASLPTYLRSASAVATTVLPDLVIVPAGMLDEVAKTGLLVPLDGLVSGDLRDDLYPFATRDTRVDDGWMALPLVVQVEHGVTTIGQRGKVPSTLERLLRDDSPVWLFRGQAREEGEMSNALLLQLLAITGELPGPDTLPPQEDFVALLATLQAAQQRGVIPRQVLLLDNEALLFDRLESEQPIFIQSNSLDYGAQRDEGSLTFAPLPTLNGTIESVVDGYLIGITTEDPRQQAAALEYLAWLLAPARLAEWSQVTHWLPAQRSALDETVEDDDYRAFLGERLESGWLRPSGPSWEGFSQAMQEQFRAVMTDQVSPVDAADAIWQSYAPQPQE